MPGSSPRMWGTRLFYFDFHVCLRFIPTHVGNTNSWSPRTTRLPVHPHACGEHCAMDRGKRGPGGSSPRMWGTQDRAIELLTIQRFIPTHVGNTTRKSLKSFLTAVHPHACGEHLARRSLASPSAGSSPRMWGTRKNRNRNECHPRFIPTHVGNTDDTANTAKFSSVHPHACGEHWYDNPERSARIGSSPRMWGTQQCKCLERISCRFIPTHVGNTSRSYLFYGDVSVHPHACGEHI